MEFRLEILGKILGIIKSDRVRYLGHRQLTLLEQLGRPLQPDMPDQLNRRLTREQQQTFIEGTPAGMELLA